MKFYVSRSALCPKCFLPHPIISLHHHIPVCAGAPKAAPPADGAAPVVSSVLHGLPGRGDGGELATKDGA